MTDRKCHRHAAAACPSWVGGIGRHWSGLQVLQELCCPSLTGLVDSQFGARGQTSVTKHTIVYASIIGLG